MVVILPTYVVCAGIYTPDIRSMWGYIVFAFQFVRTYVRSLVFPSQGQSFCVKVYKTSYFEDPLMDIYHHAIIFGMMVDIGLTFLSAPSPPQG